MFRKPKIFKEATRECRLYLETNKGKNYSGLLAEMTQAWQRPSKVLGKTTSLEFYNRCNYPSKAREKQRLSQTNAN